MKPLRVSQCNVDATCIDNTAESNTYAICNTEDGFTATMSFKKSKDKLLDLEKLIDGEKLICNPEMYDTPDACFSEKPDPKCYVC